MATQLNCLWYALDECHTKGGCAMFGKSSHWEVPHAMHLSVDHEITHFVPLKELRHAWYAIFGFNGYVVSGDSVRRGPMTKRGMLLGAVLLVILVAAWATQDTVKRIFRRFWMDDIDVKIKAVEDALQYRRARYRRKADRED